MAGKGQRCPPNKAYAAGAPPDAIYQNGKVVTVDARFAIAQAFAISGDKFVAVGNNADILALADPKTRVIDWGGKEVLPGLIDAHRNTVVGHARQEERRQRCPF